MGKASYTINEKDKPVEKLQNAEITDIKEAGKFRTILPQILASTAKNILLVDLGLSVAFPTIVIPALLGTLANSNVYEPLHFTDAQASWFGSIALICQPLGSVFSGWVCEPLGRKRAMMVVNIPHIIAWILLYYGNSIETIFVGAVLLGLGVGFMEAPIITYVGEICQPSIRGILIACAGVAVTIGSLLVYLLGSITDWRTAAIICLSVPILAVIVIAFVPETPMWLLSKNREKDAIKSLQWLRGWVSPKAVEIEFNEMQRYCENSNKCSECEKSNISCPHPPPTILDKLSELKRKRTLKAFALVIIIFALGQFSGLIAMKPFMVQIFMAYGVPIDASWGVVIQGGVSVLSTITCMAFVKFIGKRMICIISFIGGALCCIGLAMYASTNFPLGYSSFRVDPDLVLPFKYFPLIVFMILAFCTYGGILTVPWMLVSEVFPLKARGLATGIAAACSYGLSFCSTKIYMNLDKDLSLNGTMWFYAIVNILAIVFVYFFLPETENISLEEIELYFSENRKLTDVKIKKVNRIGQDIEICSEATEKIEQSKVTTSTVGLDNQNGCVNKGFNEN